MDNLEFHNYKCKPYLHIDKRISINKVKNYIAEPKKIANHSFLPFLRYDKYFYKYVGYGKGEIENRPVKIKTRSLMYAGHLDSYIYKYYSELLNQSYFDGLNKLYFKNFRTINGLFKNIDDYYRVANSIEIDNFKQFDIIKFTSDFEIKTNNLRMLALLEDDEDLDLSDNSLKSTLLTSYSKYPQQEFKEENGVFIINSNKSLTCFLKLVLGRLYTNPITQHQMEANYARKLN